MPHQDQSADSSGCRKLEWEGVTYLASGLAGSRRLSDVAFLTTDVTARVSWPAAFPLAGFVSLRPCLYPRSEYSVAGLFHDLTTAWDYCPGLNGALYVGSFLSPEAKNTVLRRSTRKLDVVHYQA